MNHVDRTCPRSRAGEKSREKNSNEEKEEKNIKLSVVQDGTRTARNMKKKTEIKEKHGRGETGREKKNNGKKQE